MTNPGFHLLAGSAPPCPDHSHTLLVLGPARSGTSMVARLLQAMGVFCGDAPDPVNVEDQRLSASLASSWRFARGRMRQVIASYDARHSTWMFKNPSHNFVLLRSLREFRSPRLVIVTRDPVAVGARVKGLSAKRGFEFGFYRCLWHNFRLAHSAIASGHPVFFLSYEKCLLQPAAIVRELAAFAGIDLSAQEQTRLAALVCPSDASYVRKWADKERLEGFVDRVNASQACGWVTLGADSPPREVELLIDNTTVSRQLADLARDDLVSAGIHHSGRCGFQFELPASLACGSTSVEELQVRVRDAATGVDLRNSPAFVRRCAAQTAEGNVEQAAQPAA